MRMQSTFAVWTFSTSTHTLAMQSWLNPHQPRRVCLCVEVTFSHTIIIINHPLKYEPIHRNFLKRDLRLTVLEYYLSLNKVKAKWFPPKNSKSTRKNRLQLGYFVCTKRICWRNQSKWNEPNPMFALQFKDSQTHSSKVKRCRGGGIVSTNHFSFPKTDLIETFTLSSNDPLVSVVFP